MLPRNGYCQLFASVAYPRGCGRIRWTSGDLGESGKLGSVGNITLFDAHNRAFAFFKETCARGIYDNMKTALETVFIAKDRQYNRRFLRMWRPLPGRGDRVHAGGGLGEGAEMLWGERRGSGTLAVGSKLTGVPHAAAERPEPIADRSGPG